ncbi:hypothetical protein NIES2104_58330 [Leptolyngbya sp. NIES-2104]|nr:hypothetical protein NIES2104_58330 [Leptolyngbya sp. NIES-2104]
MHGGWNQNGLEKLWEYFNVIDQDEIADGRGITDDDHGEFDRELGCLAERLLG